MVKALIPIANGSEEIETTTIANVLVRGGIEVELTSVHTEKEIVGSRGIHLVANSTISECKDKTYDLIALPGGMPGAEHLRDCAELIELMRAQKASGKLYAAICASPAVVLETHGLLEGRTACCYPCFKLPSEVSAPGNPRVVVSDNCVTSVGPASSMEFSLKLVELLMGKGVATKVSEGMLFSTAE